MIFPAVSIIALALGTQAAPPVASAPPPPPASPEGRGPADMIAAAPAADWVPIAAADLLVMDIAPDAAGRARRVVIQLMPPPFSQGWVGNIRTLAAAHWWDGTSVNRVQDNYVAQWGDATEKAALPAGLAKVPEANYVIVGTVNAVCERDVCPRAPAPVHSTYQMLGHDEYAGSVGFGNGWPLGYDDRAAWPVHCYGMVGVGRNLSPDTGSGAELYAVIGHAPRHLDRNIALVGRVVAGMEHLSSLPRGTGALGFYESAAERVPILRVRLGSELPVAEQPRFDYLSTESASFARYAEARASRKDAFFIRPAGGADICNVPVPIRQRAR